MDSALPPHSVAPSRPRNRPLRLAVWGLVALSVASLVFAPLGPLIERAREVGPWVGLGLLVSEVLFVVGLTVMAWSVGVRMGLNPLHWRDHMSTVLGRLDRSPLFWIGLGINTVGAVGTAVVLGAAVLTGLPLSAWGLLVLPLVDLSLTAAVRAAVVGGVRRHPEGKTTREAPPLH